MGKVTSGVHSGFFAHEVIHLIWTNLNDILPLIVCQSFFMSLIASLKAEADKAKKA